jgi:HEXXH motif-containing protein
VHRHHRIPIDQFRAVATGGGDLPDVSQLVAAERSRRLILLRTVLDLIERRPDALGPLPDAGAAWAALTRAEGRSRRAVDEVLLHPQVGAWLAHALRRLSGTTGKAPLWVDLGNVHAVCCVAAAAAGVPLRTEVPLRDGTVMLPRLGLGRLPGPGSFGIAAATVEGDRIELVSSGQRVEARADGTGQATGGAEWWPLRRLRSSFGGHQIQLYLDDIDPYRDLGGPVEAERQPDAQVRAWQELLDGAWRILVADDERAAVALAAGLQSVVPLPAAPDLTPRSASTGDAFGSLLVAVPPGPTEFAALLVHEFQHTKLGAYYHLLNLFRDDGTERFYAPWRDDPRPLSGLLQGVYAFLGVTGFWRRRRHNAPASGRELADFEFALWRRQTWRALGALRADPGLTPLGREFAAGMTDRMRGWWGDTVPAEAARLAGVAARDHWLGWRLRHMRPDPAEAAELADRWLAGGPAELGNTDRSVLVADPSAPWSLARTSLTRLRLTDPGAFDRLVGAVSGGDGADQPPPGGPPELSSADLLLAAGRADEAADQYARALFEQAGSGALAWSGLLLALAETGPSHRVLLRRPELASAVYWVLRQRQAVADPRQLSGWLAGIGHG